MPIKVSWILFFCSFGLSTFFCNSATIFYSVGLYILNVQLVPLHWHCSFLVGLGFLCYFFFNYWYSLRGKHPRNLFEKPGNFPFSAPPLPSPPLTVCFTYGNISFLVTLPCISPSPSFPALHVHYLYSLCLCLHWCTADNFLRTIFLDFIYML